MANLMSRSFSALILSHNSCGILKHCSPIVFTIPYKAAFNRHGARFLFSSEILGLEGYKRQKASVDERLGNLKDKFCSRMEDYLKTAENNTIFTDDLKSMVYLAETDSDLETTIKMVKRFHLQNADLRFSNFVFGPLVLRVLHLQNKPILAYELFFDKSLSGFFDQMSSFVVLMDLLYENKQYAQVMTVMDAIKDKQLGGFKFPMDCVTLAIASCYRVNTPKSLQHVIDLVKETGGDTNSVSLRAAIFAAMLALKQKRPEVALEMLSVASLRSQWSTPMSYINAKALTYASLGRAEEAVQLLRSVVQRDRPDHVDKGNEIFEEVLQSVQAVVAKQGNKELQHLYDTTARALQSGGHINKQNLDEFLSRPIVRMRKAQDGYKQRERAPVAGVRNLGGARSYRPGLAD